MNHLLRRALLSLPIAAFSLAATVAHAQFTTPFLSNEGLATATSIAQDSLGSDARLTAELAVSGDVGGPTTVAYDFETGKSDVWVYQFYSPSRRAMIDVGVVQIPFVGFQGGGTVQSIDSMNLGERDTVALDTSGTYATSDKLLGRVMNDTAYQRYHAANPDRDPSAAGLANMSLQDNPIFTGIDLTQPFWSVIWADEADSTKNMICLIASKTGEEFCQRSSFAASVPSEEPMGTAALAVAPNPATGRTRVSVDIPSGVRMTGVEMTLFNERGDKVMDLTESFARNGYGYAEFDASKLPAGIYYCRATGANWSGITGVIVEK